MPVIPADRHVLVLYDGRHSDAILGLLAQGFGRKEVAGALEISEATVKFHLTNIFAKLEVHDWHTAVEVAKARRLIGLPAATNRPL